MHLFSMRAGAKHPARSAAVGYPKYLSHKDEPADIYTAYQTEAVRLGIGRNGQHNLFDDSSSMDKYWFNIATEYIRSE
jgi:hypothetical protein